MTDATAPHRPVLVDAEAEAALQEHGYVILPFLDAAEVERLRAGYAELVPDPGAEDGLVIDFMREGRDVLVGVADLLAPTWAEHLPRLFVDHRVVVATYVTKHPGAHSGMLLHDEPSFVDERHHTSHALWIPLVDVSPELDNGHLLVLPDSEHLARGMAGFNTSVQHRPYEAELHGALVPVSASAGDAVVYNSRTLHASVPNHSDRPRPAIAASVVPADAPIVHVVATGRRRRRIHAVGDDFYLRVHPLTTDVLALDEPVLDELDDDTVLDPAAVAALVGRPVVAARPVVPADLEDLAGDRSALPAADRREPDVAATADLGLVAADLVAGPPTHPSVLWATDAAVEALRPGSVLAARLPEAAVAAGVGAGRPPTVAVVDAKGRLGVRSDEPGGHRLDVLDAPIANAGVVADGQASTLEPGSAVVLRPGATHVVWNSGPGALVVLLAPLPGSVGKAPGGHEAPRRWSKRWWGRVLPSPGVRPPAGDGLRASDPPDRRPGPHVGAP